MRKGIILAGGTGSRLFPITLAVSKQLLPVYNKPMIFYPLSKLMLAEIDEVLIITNPENISLYSKLLGDGSKWGMCIEYVAQEKANGIAEAFIIAEKFIGSSSVCLALGDNIFYGHAFDMQLPFINETDNIIFGCKVDNPCAYGVAEFNSSGKVLSIEEKPKNPKSDYAVPGIYFYDNSVVRRAKELKPSGRGELEITDLNNSYIRDGKLTLYKLPLETVWFDSGTHDDLLAASNFVKVIESRSGIKMADLDSIARANGWID